MQSLAVKYRPRTFDDVVEQDVVRKVLQRQVSTRDIAPAYLFCGGAGTGKTTCARIFAHEINAGVGVPIEIDAASNSGVDDVREIIRQAQTRALGQSYKVFIIDECHSISNTGWQAFLKVLEEPPGGCVFIFCTTDPQKIPKTIISRVQRFDFTRISTNGIFDRLMYVLRNEDIPQLQGNDLVDAVEYVARIADGGMRDAITLLDKCLAYSTSLTVENVVNALGSVGYDDMMCLLRCLIAGDQRGAVELVRKLFNAGKDMRLFVTQFTRFLLDVCKLLVGCSWSDVLIPPISGYKDQISRWGFDCADTEILRWCQLFAQLQSEARYSTSVVYDIEAVVMLN